MFQLDNFENMNVLEILEEGHPILRKKAESVSDIKSAGELCMRMLKTLRYTRGAGLAAPQVGISQRIIVVEARRHISDEDKATYMMINPEITYKSDKKEYGFEACLSISDSIVPVMRHKKVKVKYINYFGEEREVVFVDEFARIMQHEYDHLDGILCTDRVMSVRSIIRNLIRGSLRLKGMR